MPVRTVKNEEGEIIGYQWGTTGKIYKTRAEAEEQGRAIRAAQARRKALGDKLKEDLERIVEEFYE